MSMKFLKCIFCAGELDVLFNDRSIVKKTKCRKCGFSNAENVEKKEPEILIIRKRMPE